jgi:isopentenyldiphosphate isomerase
MENEIFDVVNLRDEVMYQERRSVIHEKGLFHRAVHIFARSKNGMWILQKRSASKDIDPLLWTSSCSGHVDAGEDYLNAAVRECEEELGVCLLTDQFLELLQISPCHETGNEFVRVFALQDLISPKNNPEEIEALETYSLSEIEKEIECSTQHFSLSFIHIFKLIKRHLQGLT